MEHSNSSREKSSASLKQDNRCDAKRCAPAPQASPPAHRKLLTSLALLSPPLFFLFPACSSQPQARIPAGPLDRTYDIKYYTRDVRRGPRVNSRPIEASFTKPDMLRGLTPPEPVLPAAIDVPAMKPLEGAMRNPDVERYDKSGLRVTMTANTAAYLKELAKHRANHLPQPVWNRQAAARAWMAAQEARGLPPVPGAPMAKRLSPWQYTHGE